MMVEDAAWIGFAIFVVLVVAAGFIVAWRNSALTLSQRQPDFPSWAAQGGTSTPRTWSVKKPMADRERAKELVTKVRTGPFIGLVRELAEVVDALLSELPAPEPKPPEDPVAKILRAWRRAVPGMFASTDEEWLAEPHIALLKSAITIYGDDRAKAGATAMKERANYKPWVSDTDRDYARGFRDGSQIVLNHIATLDPAEVAGGQKP